MRGEIIDRVYVSVSECVCLFLFMYVCVWANSAMPTVSKEMQEAREAASML